VNFIAPTNNFLQRKGSQQNLNTQPGQTKLTAKSKEQQKTTKPENT
jgi:hypothetical protein